MKQAVKLYTKTGDTGMTSLASGDRLPKHSPVFEVLGNFDELNAHIGWARSMAEFETHSELLTIQDRIFRLSGMIAGSQKSLITATDVKWFEGRIDVYQSQTHKDWYRHFLHPGGTELAARVDICRTIARRSERSLQHYISNHPTPQLKPGQAELISQFANRLSDYLFALRCSINSVAGYQEVQFNKEK